MPIENAAQLLQAPANTAGGGDSSAAERAQATEEHLQAVLRMRRLIVVGAPLLLSFLPFDFVTSRVEGDGRFWPYLVMRVALAASMFAFWLRLSSRTRAPVTPGALKFGEIFFFTWAAGNVSVFCLWLGGVTSIYTAGVLTILAARVVVSHEPWRRGLLSMLPATLAWPVTLAIGATYDPRIVAQLDDPQGRLAFALNVAYGFTVSGLVTAAGHLFWSLRRQLFANRLLGRYRLKHRLAAGGMGEVWVAWHPGIKRDVALKVLRAKQGDAVALARFEREVQATSELTHPNTIRIFDFGVTDDGVWFFVMELLHGMDFSTLVKRVGPLPAGRCVYLMEQVARALAEAHQRGILHRDIKPQNLFSCAVGGEVDYAKVLDFGIAQTAAQEQDQHLTATGTVAGTPRYMAPEVARGGIATPASDVYSLGAVCYFLLTGHAPHDYENFSVLLLAQSSKDPAPPSQTLGAPVPAELEALVMKCLRRDAGDRYPSAIALAEALSALPVLPREANPPFPMEGAAALSSTPFAIGPHDPTRTLVGPAQG